ncbi:class D beta-lactamase [Cetobacterium somerae]
MKKRGIYVVMAFLVFSLQIFALDFIESEKVEKIFKRYKENGTFVLYNPQNNEFIGYNRKRAEERFYPASTFKIYNSLIGLHTGVVKDVDEVFYKYNGEKVFLKSWARDSNLRYAMKVSQLPVYELLAKKVGMEKMQKEIERLNFGNKDIGKNLEEFWVKGPLKVSAIEQCELLAKLAKSELPYSKVIQKQVQDITILESSENLVFHGKTGWSGSRSVEPVGWFVGWIEKNGEIYSFAINLEMKDRKNLYKREEIAKESLKALGIL